MVRYRVIPCLLLQNQGLVKTVNFKKPVYLGDPINIVKIFNEKEVDELVFLDINATIENKKPPIQKISQIAGECFMPLGYGGGIRNLDDIKAILDLGVEKIIINTYAVENPDFINKASDLIGSQSIVVAIDVKKNIFGKYQVYTHGGRKKTDLHPVMHVLNMEAAGAGEILLNAIDRDGTMIGYDIDLIKSISSSVNIPVVACGGAANIFDLGKAVRTGGASAAAAGSMFVFHGRHRAVLISYPTRKEIQETFESIF
jgi:cyclase